MTEDCFAIALISMACVRDDIFDDAIGPATAREVWNDRKRAARNKLVAYIAAVVLVARTSKKLLPDCLYFGLRR